MQWLTPRESGSPWASRSADGYYAVGHAFMGQHQAFHIEALWASPLQIGEGASVTEAQEMCERHRKAAPPPA